MGLDTVDLVMKMEKEFGIEVPDQRWERVVIVQDMYEVIWEYLQGRLDNKDAMIAKIDTILIEHTGCEANELAPWKSLTSDLGLD